MALTMEDIEAAVTQTENQDAIRHSLSNYFEGLEEPVSVAIGIGSHSGDRNMHPENVDKIVNLLRENGIDAVSFLNPEAAQPDKFVVSQSGVLCPFMAPEDSLKAAVFISDTVLKNGHSIVGHINPQAVENILYTANSSIKIKNDAARLEQGINLEAAHPDKTQFKEIEQRNGGDYKGFIDRKINEAYDASEVVDFAAMDMNNVYGNGMSGLYRGGTLGNNPYATISEWNSRKVAHSSPAISICAGFSGKGKTHSSRGGGVYEKTQSGIEYGFIYEMESMGDKQQFYHNVGLETGDNPRTKDEVDYMIDSSGYAWNGHNGQIYETPVLPHHNKVKAMYLYVGRPNEQEAKLYSIPLDENGKITDPEWRDFMTLHEPTDDKVKGFLKDRQDAQKKEQTGNPSHSYRFELKQGLEADNQEYLDNISTKDFLRNFIHDGEIEEKDGTIHVDTISDGTSFDIGGLQLEKLPDLSNVKINGHWFLNSHTISEVDATKLPECTKGIELVGVEVKNVAALSADTFINILGVDKTKEGFLDCETSTHNNFSGDGIPQGWEDLKFMQLPSGVNLVYDSIDKIPETLRGIGLSGITLKDQSSIEDMSAADFIYKMKGNMGTHPLGYNISVMYSQGIRHTEIHDNIELNLEHTNIHTFPKEMKDMTLKSIVLNVKEKMTSLENFPITKEGVMDLNFEGELKNETMESFLLKTKGKEWVANNTERASDGHLIINHDFDFRTKAWGERNGPQMNITSFPKDILDVEFKGKVEPSDIGWNLERLQFLEKEKNSEYLGVETVTINLDLSQHQAKDLRLGQYNHSVALPQTLETLHIMDNKSFNMSQLQQIPASLQSLDFKNVVGNSPVDLSVMKDKKISLENCQFTSVELPKSSVNLVLNNLQTDHSVNITGVKELTAKNMNFPSGSIIDLSESKKISLENCSFPKEVVLDFSNCQRVDLNNIDLSAVKVIPPHQGQMHIGENVKFAPDFKLDLSHCASGSIDASVQCGEIKLPKEVWENKEDAFTLPASVKEISTTCIDNSWSVKKFNIPPHIKIIDKSDENGKKIPLKKLRRRGLSKEQISTLRKERVKSMFRGIVKKIMPSQNSNSSVNIQIEQGLNTKQSHMVSTTDIDKSRIVALSGRSSDKQHFALQGSESLVNIQSAEQAKTAAPQIKSEPVQVAVPQKQAAEESVQSDEKVANMSKQEKSKFLHSLRMGINTILAKAESGISAVQSFVRTQTKTETTQQPSILQMKMTKDKGKGM